MSIYKNASKIIEAGIGYGFALLESNFRTNEYQNFTELENDFSGFNYVRGISISL